MFPTATIPLGLMKTHTKITQGGDYGNNGKWVADGTEVQTPFEGVILPVISSDVKSLTFDDGGTYSEDALKMYAYEHFTDGQEMLTDEGKRYTVHGGKDYSVYGAELKIYRIERVGETV